MPLRAVAQMLAEQLPGAVAVAEERPAVAFSHEEPEPSEASVNDPTVLPLEKFSTGATRPVLRSSSPA